MAVRQVTVHIGLLKTVRREWLAVGIGNAEQLSKEEKKEAKCGGVESAERKKASAALQGRRA